MSMISMRQLLDHAAENNYGIPAFNINNMEQVFAIMNAAKKTNSPVIIQASQGARNYVNDIMLAAMAKAAVEIYPDIPVCLHLDHGASPEVCVTALAKGFTSVMMDGSLDLSKKPASFEYNAKVTKEVVKIAHYVGVSVEGEIGCIGSLETLKSEKEDGHGAEGALTAKELVTSPDEAKRFVEETGVDALAVAVGTSHGAYKFTKKPTGETLRIDVIEAIHQKIPNTHLVMHGSSSVPQKLLEIINANGGAIPETYGVPLEEIVRGIKSGVRKVNVDTDCRLAITSAIRKVFKEDPKEFDVRKYLAPAREAMEKVCIERYERFGTAGNASKIKPKSLEEMAKFYKK